MKRFSVFSFAAAIVALTAMSAAQDIASFEKRITTKKLDNGLTVILMERPEAPVFSFFTHVDAGAAQDPMGATGLAHMFEHMAFKGTDKVGTTNYAAEAKALAKVETAFAAYAAERARRVNVDQKKMEAAKKAWQDAIKVADQYSRGDEFSEIIERNGGTNLNAFTSMDETAYFYSLPANRLELWAYLESERFMHPVYRDFYKERDVVVEERRMRVESSPIGRLIEQLLMTSFTSHPYGRPNVGWFEEINNVSATDAAGFYKNYYVPANMVLTVVGDIKRDETMALIERYFGRLKKAPKPPELRSIEAPQIAERTVVLREQGQPWYVEAYHRPSYLDPDDAVYDAISDLMANGRTSRLYRSLVRDKKIALFAQGQGGFPASKYPNLYLFYGVPNQGKTTQQIAEGIHLEIERLKNEDVTDEELQMVKTRAKADLIRGLADNGGLAAQLATMQARFGDWRELFRNVERIEKVTKADIRRVAKKTFVPENRTVTYSESIAKKPAAAPAAKGDQK